MAPHGVEYVSKTQLYLRVKKPILERQRRARINKCLDALKMLVAEFQGDNTILRMDKAEMLESALAFMKTQLSSPTTAISLPTSCGQEDKLMVNDSLNSTIYLNSFRNGFINAVNEVSRVMALMPGINVQAGKVVMTHLGGEFNRFLHSAQKKSPQEKRSQPELSKNQCQKETILLQQDSFCNAIKCDTDFFSAIERRGRRQVGPWRPW